MLAHRLVQCYLSTLVQYDENVLQHIWSYKMYASGGIYSFGTDRDNCPMHSWGKTFRGLSFFCWVVQPLWSVLPSQASLT
jgi:hypothetical protein